jgi:hypothetical protein
MQTDKINSRLIRAPSPWDKFSGSPSPHSEGLEIEMRRSDGIPKLVPEVEQVGFEGVEYGKLIYDCRPSLLVGKCRV